MGKLDRQSRWGRRKGKHRNDYDHGKGGWVSGNPRYNRKKRNHGNDHRPHRCRPGAGTNHT